MQQSMLTFGLKYFSSISTCKKGCSDANLNNYYLNFHGENSVRSSTRDIRKIFFNNPEIDEPNPPYQISTESSFANTFINQVLAVVVNPKLLQNPDIMPEAKEKARQYLSINKFAVGAYSDSRGVLALRKNIAKWYARRDGYEIKDDHIYLTHGSNNAYETAVNIFSNQGDSILIEKPCDPFYLNYNRAIKLENIFYDIRQSHDFAHLTELLKTERNKGKTIKAIVVSNPHDPLGSVMTPETMQTFIKFCKANHLVLIANEVLQDSIYDDKKDKFISFRHMINKMNSDIELFSLYSISNGPFFNGAFRGGILDFMNISQEIVKEIYKYKSIDLCSAVTGQVTIDLCLDPQKELGEEFFKKFEKSVTDFRKRLKTSKNKVFQQLKNDRDYEDVNDIQAGYSFFVKTLKTDKKVIIDNHIQLKTIPGKLYGDNLDDYVSITINRLV